MFHWPASRGSVTTGLLFASSACYNVVSEARAGASAFLGPVASPGEPE